MKKSLLLILLAVSIFTSASAQSTLKTAYFMPGATNRSDLNAALAPSRGYINLPVISGTYLELNTGSLTLSNILYPSSDGSGLVTFMDGSVDATTFLANIQDMNSLEFSQSSTLFGLGWYTKRRSFWSLDLSLRSDLSVNIPGDLFEFIKKGTGTYDASGLGISMNVFQQTSLGYSGMIGKKFRFGINLKLLACIASADIYFSKLDIDLNSSQWSIDAVGNLSISGEGLSMGTNSEGYLDFDDLSFDTSSLGIAGLGGAIDFGISWDLHKNFTISAAINDLGYVKLYDKSTISGVSNGSFMFSGFDVSGESSGLDTDDIQNIMNFTQTSGNGEDVTNYLTPIVNAGIEWRFAKNIFSLGVLGQAKLYESGNSYNLTGSLGFNPFKWISFYGSYTIDDQGDQSIGAAFNFHPCWINIFVGTDYTFSEMTPQYIPTNQSNLNVYFGVGIPLNRDPALKRVKKNKNKE